MKCVLTSSVLPWATVMDRVQVVSTVGKRSSGVNCWRTKLQVPGSVLPAMFLTVQVSTSAPEKLARTQPRSVPEMIERKPVVPVLLEPVIEYGIEKPSGCNVAGFSSLPHGGPQPMVYESGPSQDPVQRQPTGRFGGLAPPSSPSSSLSASATWSQVSGGGGGGG